MKLLCKLQGVFGSFFKSTTRISKELVTKGRILPPRVINPRRVRAAVNLKVEFVRNDNAFRTFFINLAAQSDVLMKKTPVFNMA